MDITREINNHLVWIDRIASLLDSENLTAEELQDISRQDQCALGEWLDSEASQRFGELPEFQKLLDSHKAFHELAGKLIQSLQQGRDSEAIEAHGQFLEMSQEVVRLLEALQKNNNDT